MSVRLLTVALALLSLAPMAPMGLASHQPPECYVIGFDRSNPDCAFGMCVHHPPEAPAFDVCFAPDCGSIQSALEAAGDRLRDFVSNNGQLIEDMEELEALLRELDAGIEEGRQLAIAEVERIENQIPEVREGDIPDYWTQILRAWGTASAYHGIDADPLAPPDADTQAWSAENATEGMRELEGAYGALADMAKVWEDAFHDWTELSSIRLAYGYVRAILDGDIASLRDALARCEAAQESESP